MPLDHLWAGWRSDYVGGVGQDGPGDKGCVFCRILASQGSDEDKRVVWRGAHTVALLNAYPYSTGHLMVMPLRHVGELEELTGEESSEVWAAVTAGVVALKSAFRPDGINVGANLGRSAGAGVPGHFHVHALPRWSGDTNFMTTVADTRVLPESLGVTWAKVASSWPPVDR